MDALAVAVPVLLAAGGGGVDLAALLVLAAEVGVGSIAEPGPFGGAWPSSSSPVLGGGTGDLLGALLGDWLLLAFVALGVGLRLLLGFTPAPGAPPSAGSTRPCTSDAAAHSLRGWSAGATGAKASASPPLFLRRDRLRISLSGLSSPVASRAIEKCSISVNRHMYRRGSPILD